MSITNHALPPVGLMLAEDADTAPNAQISQEALQGAAYRLRTVPPVGLMLAEDADTAPNAQISQEALQGAAYRLRTAARV
ncbi:MAG TPA: hypothetical protein VGZ32_26815 [Actinocrinis sp.]|jgi:hypothetical protein|uniref:hypothetical protein n=1 Tax=Actinocrinis sp. TaxID=1920516 RepID=UPI002DDD9BE7|nr:hypothetical protein [Actinocrinis sp.]HEV3173990.1 hypothetical protein [Actinocrinis sp.]